MRCPACTQRNSVAARSCKFCGQKLKSKAINLPGKAIAGIAAAVLVVGVASAVVPMLKAPDAKLGAVADRMAAGPKSPEEAQLMQAQLDSALIKYLENNGSSPSGDLLTKLQSELPTSTFEVLVFDLPNQIKLVEVDCVLQPSDYLVVPSGAEGKNVKVSRLANFSVFDEARMLSSKPEPTLVLIGHSTGEGPRETQFKALAVLPSGEISDRTDKYIPIVKGTGMAQFASASSNDIKLERMLVATAKHQGLFVGDLPFKEETYPATLVWKKSRYEPRGSIGTSEFGALYAVATGLVEPTDIDEYRSYVSADVIASLKALGDKTVPSPGGFKLAKLANTHDTSRRRARRSRGDEGQGQARYSLIAGDRAFEVALTKSGRWSATSVKETSPPSESETVAMAAPPEKTTAPVIIEKAPDTSAQDEAKQEALAAKKRKAEEKKRLQEEKRQRAEEERRVAEEKRRADEKKRIAESKNRRETEPSGGPGQIITESSSSVTMRSGPGRKYGQIMNISKGSKVRILGESNGWYKISANGRTGYVYHGYLKQGTSSGSSSTKVAKEKKPAPTPAPTKTASKSSTKVTSRPSSKSSTTASSSRASKYKNQLSSGGRSTSSDDHEEPDFVP